MFAGCPARGATDAAGGEDGGVLQVLAGTKSYRLGESLVPGLRAANLHLRRGEFVAVQGPSGSGKSTLLQICGLLDRLDQGECRFAGVSVAGLDESALTGLRRQRIGFIFQSYNLIPVMSVADNVAYPLRLLGVAEREVALRVEAMLARVGLAGLAARRPDQLSGGQRQRVAVARALVKSPWLVIADEPTANLDSATAGQIIDLLGELAADRGATVLVATHDERMTRHCGRVCRMEDGVLP
jgi:putative ABC transport system ATP-binding protein